MTVVDLPFIFAHGSGIDDALWFLIPVVLAVAWMRRTEKRASERAEQDRADTEQSQAEIEDASGGT